MSDLIVEVCEVADVRPHTNADRLEIATVKGWQVCVGKGSVSVGDLCVFFPPDSVLPPELAHGPDDSPAGRLDVAKYGQPLPKNDDGVRPPGYRVKAARLRGEPSFGVLMLLEDHDGEWSVGDDVSEHYGVTKWEPPVKVLVGDTEAENPLFAPYTSIENIRNYPDVFQDGDHVVVTEKIHGKNCRVGYIEEDGKMVFAAGSHKVRRKPPQEGDTSSEFWAPLDNQELRRLLTFVQNCTSAKSVVVYGEIYGEGVQKGMAYGMAGRGFRIFDLSIDGKYVDQEYLLSVLCSEIEVVPVLYDGPFYARLIEDFTDGDTRSQGELPLGKFKGREGIVIKSATECHDDSGGLRGRKILKSISADYLDRNDIADESQE